MSRRTMILFAVGIILLVASLFSLKMELTPTDKPEAEETEADDPEVEPKPEEQKPADNGTL